LALEAGNLATYFKIFLDYQYKCFNVDLAEVDKRVHVVEVPSHLTEKPFEQ